MKSKYLPIYREEAREIGWEELDIIIISGDAYVDHPSFGAAVISRVLESEGYRVGIIPQPDWKSNDDFKRLGRPKLFFGVTAGNMDSMVNHYSPSRRRRDYDAYSPGGKIGFRPDRASIVYANKIRETYKDVPIVLGGIEASLRRFAHYDYWDNRVRQSILADSPADILVYGMGEYAVKEIARRLKAGRGINEIKDIPGTTIKTKEIESMEATLDLPSFQEVSYDKEQYALAFRLTEMEQNPITGNRLVQPHPKTLIVQNRPGPVLNEKNMGRIYGLPFTRKPHPTYGAEGIPAFNTINFSITTHRGCFGSCSFCAISAHQGRIIQNRSSDSILDEVNDLTRDPDFRGTITDIGGPSQNMYSLGCPKQEKKGACKDKLCLFPEPCKNLDTDHGRLLELLKEIRKIPGIKHAFIGSGVRYDLALLDKSGYLEEICAHHISGQLKIAPEHISKKVTDKMRKPDGKKFDEFSKKYEKINKNLGKKQFLVPYFMASHPGCSLTEMIELAQFMRDMNYFVEQVQEFTPTPMTASTTMYYTGIDPYTMKKVHIPRGRERTLQRALIQYSSPRYRDLVKEALEKAGRKDLIGKGKKTLVR